MGLKIAIVLSFLATCGKALKISDAENWIVVYMMKKITSTAMLTAL